MSIRSTGYESERVTYVLGMKLNAEKAIPTPAL